LPRPPSSAALRRRLVEELESKGNLTSKAVRRAFLTVPREHFLSPTLSLDEAYANKAIVTRTDAHGAPASSSSQPTIMALMLERLDLAPGMRVLEIGAGTGYNAALLSTIVGTTGSVTSVDLEPDVADGAAAALASRGYQVEVATGDGREGWPANAPYDRIVLTASTGSVPRPLFDQLAAGGLLQLPFHLDGPDLQAVVTLRKEGSRLTSVDAVEGGFMVLRDPARRSVPGFRGSGVSVNEHVEGRHRTHGALNGKGVGRLNAAARRRLAALMLEKPRVRTVAGSSAPGRSPVLWFQLAHPRGAVVAHYFRTDVMRRGRWAAAVAGLDGRSLTVAVFGATRGIRVESYGDGSTDAVFERLLADWRDRGRPGTRDLDVTITYPGNGDGSPRTRIGWRSATPRR
jgi:protein-L-isoaspartate(D-aspartate) O-methyltransferase